MREKFMIQTENSVGNFCLEEAKIVGKTIKKNKHLNYLVFPTHLILASMARFVPNQSENGP